MAIRKIETVGWIGADVKEMHTVNVVVPRRTVCKRVKTDSGAQDK